MENLMNTLAVANPSAFELTPGKSYDPGSTDRAALEAALEAVRGYCAFNDLSARTFQRGSPQWTMGKNAERSGPMGAIVSADEGGDPRRHLVS